MQLAANPRVYLRRQPKTRRSPKWHSLGSIFAMNKGKPSGFKADTKKDAGVRSTTRERRGQAGAGPEWTERQKQREGQMVHTGGEGGPEQNAGGPDHRGGPADEDRTP